jgi:hypothetical protein
MTAAEKRKVQRLDDRVWAALFAAEDALHELRHVHPVLARAAGRKLASLARRAGKPPRR